MDTTVRTGAQKFTMNGLQLLSSGTHTTALLAAENLWLHSKVYSRGGENALHAHTTEDHAFFVLQGAAEFTFGDGSTMLAERFDGVMIPKGTLYKFEAQGEGNLIMLRMGAGHEAPANVRNALGIGDAKDEPVVQLDIIDEDGRPILNNKSAHKGRSPGEPRIAIPGKFFGSEPSHS
jgi:mannose-6-phosphate isomerase-like protein (cupin superfamily)